MAKINLLDSAVFNRIAAGEVVENPRSVVKELIDNSIDSGAKSVYIEIENGGISYICVSDDGVGMEREDVERAVLPHATSKISSTDDLDGISTLGFRGEALASIASVSNIKITSRERGSELGSFIEYDFGQFIGSGECGHKEGTSVEVRDLFSKIPARRKFLKKAGMERAEVTSLVQRAILANYNVSIKYVADGEIIYHSSGNGLVDALYAAYGREFVDNLVYFENTMSDIECYGMVGKAGFSKHNRTFQTLVVNGRYVVNNDIGYLVKECYRDYLMTRQFPVWIIFIDIPFDMLDVNIHPSKMDVKFVDLGRIKKALYSTICKTISSSCNLSYPIEQIFLDQSMQSADKQSQSMQVADKQSQSMQASQSMQVTDNLAGQGEQNPSIVNTNKSKIYSDGISQNIQNVSFSGAIPPVSHLRERPALSQFIENEAFFAQNQDSQSHLKELEQGQSEVVFGKSELDSRPAGTGLDLMPDARHFGGKADVKVLCKVFNTYIMIQYGNDVFLIDQHAAHERIIFDALISRCGTENVVQPLLLPYVFDLTAPDAQVLAENLQIFEDLGFVLASLSGNSFSLSAVPLACCDIDCGEFITYFFDSIKNSSKTEKAALNRSEFLRERAASAACKAAVKGKDDLKKSEIDMLIQKLMQVEQLFCPHGRPIVIKITKTQIEKWFKRIQ